MLTLAKGRARWAVLPALGLAVVLAACSAPADRTPDSALPSSELPVPTPGTTSATPTRTPPKPTPTRKPTPKPKPTATKVKPVTAGGDIPKKPAPTKPPSDGVPVKGNGKFTSAAGGTDVVGTGAKLVQYQVEIEGGIAWGTNPVWTPASFAEAVDTILANPRSWIASAEAPVTNAPENMTNASWSFQRVGVADSKTLHIRLATPDTVDKLCGQAGVDTEGQYSCRFGSTLMINLRRWLKGVPGFGTDLSGYRNMVINHEMGHFLGFNHMLCPGAGKPAPVMQTQTISLAGCKPNSYPFSAETVFVIGPWAPS